MTADQGFHCSKAPTPVPDERAFKTEQMSRDDFVTADGGGGKGWYVLGAFLALAIAAGVVFALVKNGSGSSVSASVPTETVAEGSGSSQVVATATPTDSPPQECLGDLTKDATLGYYCNHILPMAKIGKADHARIDRLEAASKDGIPLALWVIVIAIGVLVVYNTVKIHSAKNDRPPG